MLLLRTETAPQGTEDWRQDRAGCATASRFGDILAKLKNGDEAKTRADYRMQLVVERLTGIVQEGYQNEAMRWGKDHEEEAREAYEHATGHLVEVVGFQPHPMIEWCGASPDGLVDEDGGVEIKCPFNSAVHLDNLMRGLAIARSRLRGEPTTLSPIPPEYVPQVQGNIWCLGRKWWDFVSYDPRFPKHLQLYIHRLSAGPTYFALLEQEITKFLGEVDDLVEQLGGNREIPEIAEAWLRTHRIEVTHGFPPKEAE